LCKVTKSLFLDNDDLLFEHKQHHRSRPTLPDLVSRPGNNWNSHFNKKAIKNMMAFLKLYY